MIGLYLITVLLSFLPISELRGAIPFAYFNGIDIISAFAVATISNALVGPVGFIFLQSLHKLLYKWNLYKRFFDKTVSKTRIKISDSVKKHGLFGLMLFVAVPLPVTGAWTATLGAWVLGLDKKKSCLAIAGGVLIAGLVVTALILTGAGLNSIFIKQVTI